MLGCRIALYTLLVSLSLSFHLQAQITSVFTEGDRYFNEGMELYNNASFGLAKQKFEQASKSIAIQFDDRSNLLKRRASFMAAKSALLGGFPEGEKLLLDFFNSYRPDPFSYQALVELANLKYVRKSYNEAIKYYEQIDLSTLSEDQKLEVLFKKGYSYFVKKRFPEAGKAFEQILGKTSEYYYHTYYYLAMVNFFEKEYDSALENFFIIENYSLYKNRIPYYIAQIYFAQGQYQDIASYIPRHLSDRNLKNVKEIRHILGQTYFILNEHNEALPHLEYYEKNTQKMRKEDFYQLAFTQYQVGHYEDAVSNFKELSKLDTRLGQISNNYLADCFMKLGNKEEARISFKNVMDYEFDVPLREEATLNYGKLSAELGYDRAAMNTLMELEENSAQYSEAQLVLADLFESSKDYEMVINTIESLEVPAPRIKEAYQKVALEWGIQLLKDRDYKEAKKILQKGVETPIKNE